MIDTWRHTSWDPRKSQNPDASAERMNTWPVSRSRIPKQTSASHILLYSRAFFIKLDLRRHCFCRINFLFEEDRCEVFFGAMIPRDMSWRCGCELLEIWARRRQRSGLYYRLRLSGSDLYSKKSDDVDSKISVITVLEGIEHWYGSTAGWGFEKAASVK